MKSPSNLRLKAVILVGGPEKGNKVGRVVVR